MVAFRNGTFLMNGDGTECVGLEMDKDKVNCKKILQKNFTIKRYKLNEKFDAINILLHISGEIKTYN